MGKGKWEKVEGGARVGRWWRVETSDWATEAIKWLTDTLIGLSDQLAELAEVGQEVHDLRQTMGDGLQALKERLEDLYPECKEPNKKGMSERLEGTEGIRTDELAKGIVRIIEELEEMGRVEIEVEVVAEVSGRPQ